MNRVSSMISTLLCEAATAPTCERKVVSILATAVGQGHIDLDLVCKVEHWDCKSGSFVNLSNLQCAFYDLYDALCEALKLLSSFRSSPPSLSPSSPSLSPPSLSPAGPESSRHVPGLPLTQTLLGRHDGLAAQVLVEGRVRCDRVTPPALGLR